jgi:hypothetical protein
MAHMENPAQLAAGGAPVIDQAGSSITPVDTTPARSEQGETALSAAFRRATRASSQAPRAGSSTVKLFTVEELRPDRTPRAARPTFTIVLRAEPHVTDPVRALRAALKRLLRSYGLRAVSVEQKPANDGGQP